jgi:hypothetical protein
MQKRANGKFRKSHGLFKVDSLYRAPRAFRGASDAKFAKYAKILLGFSPALAGGARVALFTETWRALAPLNYAGCAVTFFNFKKALSKIRGWLHSLIFPTL